MILNIWRGHPGWKGNEEDLKAEISKTEALVAAKAAKKAAVKKGQGDGTGEEDGGEVRGGARGERGVAVVRVQMNLSPVKHT